MKVTGADFSADRKYRYSLWRVWDFKLPTISFCMLNPSTADENNHDPTVERCQRRANMLGYGTLIVVNLFAYRATEPYELYQVENNGGDPIGELNDRAILDALQTSKIMVCGWGQHGLFLGRGSKVLIMLKKRSPKRIHALSQNTSGQPTHPLYLPYNLTPYRI
jgi:hypothetical protein